MGPFLMLLLAMQVFAANEVNTDTTPKPGFFQKAAKAIGGNAVGLVKYPTVGLGYIGSKGIDGLTRLVTLNRRDDVVAGMKAGAQFLKNKWRTLGCKSVVAEVDHPSMKLTDPVDKRLPSFRPDLSEIYSVQVVCKEFCHCFVHLMYPEEIIADLEISQDEDGKSRQPTTMRKIYDCGKPSFRSGLASGLKLGLNRVRGVKKAVDHAGSDCAVKYSLGDGLGRCKTQWTTMSDTEKVTFRKEMDDYKTANPGVVKELKTSKDVCKATSFASVISKGAKKVKSFFTRGKKAVVQSAKIHDADVTDAMYDNTLGFNTGVQHWKQNIQSIQSLTTKQVPGTIHDFSESETVPKVPEKNPTKSVLKAVADDVKDYSNRLYADPKDHQKTERVTI